MSIFKQILFSVLIAYILFLIAACRQNKNLFKYENDISYSFFQENIPKVAWKSNNKKGSLGTIEVVEPYRVIFKERLVESDNVLEYALMNESSKRDRVRYKQHFGYRQELYLFRTPTPQDSNSFVYFSVKFNPDNEAIGFGPVYYGTMYEQDSLYIFRFTEELKVKGEEGNYYLKKRCLSSKKLLFICNSWGYKSKEYIKVAKIVQENKNNIGGEKSVVFPIDTLFSDSTALEFKYLTPNSKISK